MLDTITAAALLTGGAILLPALTKAVPDFDGKEVLTRTGTRLIRPEEKSKLALQIVRSGLKVSPEAFAGIRALITGAGIILGILLSFISGRYVWLLLLSPLLYFLPAVYLKSRIKARQSAIRIALSRFTVLLSITLQSGTELLMSIKETSNAIGGPLKEELDLAIKDNMASRPLAEALQEMSRRVDVDELNSLVRTLSQVQTQGGASMAEIMLAYSEQMRIVKKYENMELAGQLSVKLILPILLFILVPCILVIGFPAVYALLQAF